MLTRHALRHPLLAVPLTVLVVAVPAVAAHATVRSTVNGTTINDHGTKNVSGATSVAMAMGPDYFSPSTLQGKPGQTITINLTNSSSFTHTFTLSSQGVDTTVAPGAKTSVTVKFPTSGSTVFICSFHTSMGMNGALQALAVSSPTPTATATATASTAGSGATGSGMTSGSTTGSTGSGGSGGSTGQVAPVPAGGAATGAGGTSYAAGLSGLATVVGVGLGALLVVAGVVRLRRRRPHHG